MSHLKTYRFLAIVLLAVAALPLSSQAATAPDSTLYTNYFGSLTSLTYFVCGSTASTSGCYAFGTLGPFVGIGAMLEGTPSIKGNVVTRSIYVVDSGAATVKLFVYKKTDTVTSDFDTVVVTLARTITLPLTGGPSAVVSMAANNGFVFIGTDQSQQGVAVKKSNLTVTPVGGGFSPPLNVTSITVDQYGYATVTEGNGTSTAFVVIAPDGGETEDGGGSQIMLGTQQGVPGSALTTTEAPQHRMEVHPKNAGQ